METAGRSAPIAVFDSGVGGLTVLHECLVSLPHEDYVYLGDTARFPYGDRSQAELESFTLELGGRLVDSGAKLLVVACNSATAAALPALRRELSDRVPVLSVVTPESRLAASTSRNGRVGLLATEATLQSGAYEAALADADPAAALHAVACPELAPLIQSGGEVDDELVALTDTYCEPLRRADVDTVILGCTHYPLVRPLLQRLLGRGVTLISSGQAIADEIERHLRATGLEATSDGRGEYRFLCSGDPDEFRRVGTRFLQLPLRDIRHVDVDTTPWSRRAVA